LIRWVCGLEILPAGRQPKKKKQPKAVKEPKAVKAAKAVPAPKKAKMPKKGGSGGGGKGGEGGEGGGDDGGEEKEEFTANGRRKRKDIGKTRAVPRSWTEEEERLFREALELHGRTWQKCAEHVGTRDSKSFTSHAQKYFIKLCLQGKALPRAVEASGEGYTLSGKPLDPNSATAMQYGFKPDTLNKIAAAGGDAPGFGAGLLSEEDSAAAAAEADRKASAKADKTEEKAAVPKPLKNAAGGAMATKESLEPCEPTEYARNRPRREVAVGAAAGGPAYRDAGGGTLDLHEMRRFAPSAAGSGAAGAQPFKLIVAPSALLIMDLHAHLCTNEVIGYLGGAWDPDSRTIRVERAFPGRGVASGMDVEMDPVAEVELQTAVEALGLTVVGWYHSHPVFEPTPSGVDIVNQLNYQSLFRDDKTGVDPFVGFIVGPYDTRLPTPVSKVTAFVAQRRRAGGARGGVAEEEMPFEVSYTVTDDPPTVLTRGAMAAVVVANAAVPGRVNPTELWRSFTTFTDSTPGGGPCTKLGKMRASLAARLPAGMDEKAVDQILDGVASQMQTAWGVDLGY